MFPNLDRLARYAEAGLVDPHSARAALIGYPKVDCLVDGSLDRRAIERELELDPALPTVIYAPTWSPYSSLNSDGEAILRALTALRLNVVVKLHDRSQDGTSRGSVGSTGGNGSRDSRATADKDRQSVRMRRHICSPPTCS